MWFLFSGCPNTYLNRGTQSKNATSCGNLSVRERSDSNTVFICARAKRQQHGFYLCESEATATRFLSVRERSDSNTVFICAKAKRQQHGFYLCESEATATRFYLCESDSNNNNDTRLSDQHHVAAATLALHFRT